MKYRDYRIEKFGDNYAVKTPSGEMWSELAVNRKTARRWIDAHIAEKANQPDVFVRNEGSIFLLTPMSDAAREWIGEHIPEDAQYMGRALVVEHRYVEDIVAGMQSDGLIVK
jgi:hypothetical protein